MAVNEVDRRPQPVGLLWRSLRECSEEEADGVFGGWNRRHLELCTELREAPPPRPIPRPRRGRSDGPEISLTVASSAGASSREEYRKRRNTEISSSLAVLCPAVAVSRTGRGASAWWRVLLACVGRPAAETRGIVTTVGRRRAMGRAGQLVSRTKPSIKLL